MSLPRMSFGLPVRTWPGHVGGLPPVPPPTRSPRWHLSAVEDRGTRSAPPSVTRGLHDDASWWAPSERAARRTPVGAVPGWQPEDDLVWYHADPAFAAALRVFAPLDDDGDALLARLHTTRAGVLGRPIVEYLPDELAEGMVVVRHEADVDGRLTVRVDVARRAFDLDIVLSARLADPSVLDDAVTALVRLLAAVEPIGIDA